MNDIDLRTVIVETVENSMSFKDGEFSPGYYYTETSCEFRNIETAIFDTNNSVCEKLLRYKVITLLEEYQMGHLFVRKNSECLNRGYKAKDKIITYYCFSNHSLRIDIQYRFAKRKKKRITEKSKKCSKRYKTLL